MKNILLAPAVKLMQQLKLLPKFIVLTTIFVVPLAFSSMLLLTELDKSIELTRQERVGVQHLQSVQEIIQLTQRHRAYQHMAIMGNAGAEPKVQQLQKDINIRLAAFNTMQKKESALYAGTAWKDVQTSWKSLQEKLSTTRERKVYNDYTALIMQLYRFQTLIADRSNLTHDPEVVTYYLAGLVSKDFPQIAEGLAEIAGRGAAYIDSGLIEANEDVLLGSTMLVTRRDLVGIQGQFDAVFREDPALKETLVTALKSIPSAVAYLDRAKNEVLNSVDQTSGDQFMDAGRNSIDGVFAATNASAQVLDKLLQARMEQDIFHRTAIMGAILGVLAIAVYFLIGCYLSFSTEVRELNAAVTRVAAGDLRNRMTSHGKDEIAQLLNAFSGMSDGLTQLVRQVRSGSDTIAIASGEIAAGNLNLSTRTEEQASSLEETSAAMEQLTSTVRQNAVNAQHANQLSKSASGVAEQGGTVVSQVVDTMNDIQQSSHKISDIVGVVDSIAFQTNILALNAAVEAARAGEQGRGFAVVAAEVRSLAQRSAVAAREIKGLIAESVAKVEAGSKQVDLAGQTMGQIVESISRVTLIMEEIATASHEQQAGIEHINQALVQMDDITQQNAALVEEAAAAADSMREQTAHLSNTVAVFKLAHDAGANGFSERMVPNVTSLVKGPTKRPMLVAKTATQSQMKKDERMLAVANG
jgi:methyl-accepting chemotaxis protein